VGKKNLLKTLLEMRIQEKSSPGKPEVFSSLDPKKHGKRRKYGKKVQSNYSFPTPQIEKPKKGWEYPRNPTAG